MGNFPYWLRNWMRSPRQDRRVVENGVFVERGVVQRPVPVREQTEPEPVVEQTNVPEREQTVVIGGFEVVTEVTDGPGSSSSTGSPLETESGDGVRPVVEGNQGNESYDCRLGAEQGSAPEQPREADRGFSAPSVSVTDDEVDSTFHILPMPSNPADAWQFLEQSQKVAEKASGASDHPEPEETDAVGEWIDKEPRADGQPRRWKPSEIITVDPSKVFHVDAEEEEVDGLGLNDIGGGMTLRETDKS